MTAMRDHEIIAAELLKTATIPTSTIPTPPQRPPLPPGLEWSTNHLGQLRVREAGGTLLGHTDTDRRLASHPKALAYLAAVVNLDRLTPQRAAENRWADHLAEQAQALEGLEIAVDRLLRQLTGVARMQVPDLVPNQELATLCRELRDAGWVVDLELSGDGGTRRLVLATPGEQLPISEPTALRQALAETLRAVSYDAMPAWLISQAAAAVEAMLVERVHAIPESIGAREAGA
jgi:hypothetical protein